MPLDTTIPTPSGDHEHYDGKQTHPAVVAIQEADSPEDAFGAAVIAMAVDINETPHLVERTTEEFGDHALALLPAPVLATLLALAVAELAEMSLSAERAAEPIPLSEHPLNEWQNTTALTLTPSGGDKQDPKVLDILSPPTLDGARTRTTARLSPFMAYRIEADGTDVVLTIRGSFVPDVDGSVCLTEVLRDDPASSVEAPSSDPVPSVLPLGAYVRVETSKPDDEGNMVPDSYVGMVRGYDIGNTKYNIGRRYTSWDEFKFGDGGWWCFLSEATEITYEEAHTK